MENKTLQWLNKKKLASYQKKLTHWRPNHKWPPEDCPYCSTDCLWVFFSSSKRCSICHKVISIQPTDPAVLASPSLDSRGRLFGTPPSAGAAAAVSRTPRRTRSSSDRLREVCCRKRGCSLRKNKSRSYSFLWRLLLSAFEQRIHATLKKNMVPSKLLEEASLQTNEHIQGKHILAMCKIWRFPWLYIFLV